MLRLQAAALDCNRSRKYELFYARAGFERQRRGSDTGLPPASEIPVQPTQMRHSQEHFSEQEKDYRHSQGVSDNSLETVGMMSGADPVMVQNQVSKQQTRGAIKRQQMFSYLS